MYHSNSSASDLTPVQLIPTKTTRPEISIFMPKYLSLDSS